MNDNEFKNEAQLEQFRSVIQLATMAVKNAILINGGAAIALITFIGNAKFDLSISCLVTALQLFCFGVALAAFSTAFGYFAQNSHLSDLINNKKTNKGIRLGALAAALVLLSYAMFVSGSVLASFSFQ